MNALANIQAGGMLAGRMARAIYDIPPVLLRAMRNANTRIAEAHAACNRILNALAGPNDTRYFTGQQRADYLAQLDQIILVAGAIRAEVDDLEPRQNREYRALAERLGDLAL